MDFLVSLPTWAVTGIIGAIAALIGGLISWSLQHRFREGSRVPQIITTVAIGIGVALGITVLIPALESSTAAQCREAEEGAVEVNRMAGNRIDDVTTAGQFVVDCATRSILWSMNVSVPVAEVTEMGMAAVQQNFNSAQCNEPLWRSYIDAGWTISSLYTFSDGATRIIVASCAPAAATPPATTTIK